MRSTLNTSWWPPFSAFVHDIWHGKRSLDSNVFPRGALRLRLAASTFHVVNPRCVPFASPLDTRSSPTRLPLLLPGAAQYCYVRNDFFMQVKFDTYQQAFLLHSTEFPKHIPFFLRRFSLFPQTIPTWEWTFSFPRLFPKQSYDLGKFYPRCPYQVVTTSQNRQQEAETGDEAGGGPWGTWPGRSGHRVRSWCWQELWVNSGFWVVSTHNFWILVGGLEHDFYVSIYWEWSSQLTNIFQRSWNHQPDNFWISLMVNIC